MAPGRLGFALILLSAALAVAQPGPSAFSLQWITNPSSPARVALEVSGLPEPARKALQQSNWTASQWQRLLQVRTEPADVRAAIEQPSMLGEYQVNARGIRFEPRFPLMLGVTYRANFYPGQLPQIPGARDPRSVLSSLFQLASPRTVPSTRVSRIHPSPDVLPENLLKFYLHFSAPMSGGHVYDYIHLLNEAGRAIELPFLEIDEELWNRDMTRLTLFIDPGRIKREVQPLEEIGPALENGKRYTLNIDAEWKDAEGLALKGPFRKMFQVGPPVRDPIDPAQWKIMAPASGSRDAVRVQFPRPMDHALALRWIRVFKSSGEKVDGEPALEDQERRWTFTPAQPWTRGAHQLMVQTTIEDLSGNNIGKAFEVDLVEPVQRRLTNSVATIGFRIE